jgi:hypothetical protein
LMCERDNNEFVRTRRWDVCAGGWGGGGGWNFTARKMFMFGNVLQGYRTGRTFRRDPFKLTSAMTHIKCISFCILFVRQIEDSRCWKLMENGIDILLNSVEFIRLCIKLEIIKELTSC